MRTFPQRFMVLLTSALLATTTAITGCAIVDLGRPTLVMDVSDVELATETVVASQGPQ